MLTLLTAFATAQDLSPAEIREIAREAYTYGFPLVESYKTLHKQAIDKTSPDYKAPLNQLGHSRSVATPADRFVVTPNSDTPYSFAWLDLRAEPIVIHMPKIERNRYYSVQLIDMLTQNFAYLGTRAFGNEGGDFLITGPGWTGEKPAGISAIIPCETLLLYALFRTQLFNAADLPRVHEIQDEYQVWPLSQYLGKPAPADLPVVNWPRLTEGMSDGPAAFGYLNFLLQFCPPHPSEVGLMERLSKLGIGAGQSFDFEKLPPDRKASIADGIKAVWQEDFAGLMKKINAREVTSGELFGTRDFLKNNYLYRLAGAKLGLYGNSREEALYPTYFVDGNQQKLDGSKHSYSIRFEKGQLPPAGAFWSLTMYDGQSQFLVENPINRYLLNSTMLESFHFDEDGSLTFFVQSDSPGADKEANWLPAPNGPFYCVLRIYLPQPEVFSGQWEQPALQASTDKRQTRIGTLEFDHGLPTDGSAAKLYDELDFQRGCQAYVWALPIVGFAEWQASAAKSFGAGDLDYVIYKSFEDKLGILTPNATTPYILAFSDLSKTGPLVVEVPAGASAGGVLDFWQRPITDTGFAGPDKGEGARYLILPPGAEEIHPEGYRVFRSPTFNVFAGHRALDPDPAKADAWVKGLRIYPFEQRDNPPPTRFLRPEGRQWSQIPPRGLAYWERLADILNREPVETRDRFWMAMLAPLGIEKGQPFNPDARQKKLLEEACNVGEAMAQTLSFNKRSKNARYRPDSHWDYLIMLDPSQEAPFFSQLDERADYFYQAVTTTSGMVSKTPGVGQAYLGTAAYHKDGSRFDGASTYRLRVPAGAPVKQFWSLTLYDADTRSFIVTKEQIADRSSRMELTKNLDGTIDVYMGPKAPKGFEKNWIPTVPGRGWFALFRLYAPTEAYFDRTWPLNDIEKVD